MYHMTYIDDDRRRKIPFLRNLLFDYSEVEVREAKRQYMELLEVQLKTFERLKGKNERGIEDKPERISREINLVKRFKST